MRHVHYYVHPIEWTDRQLFSCELGAPPSRLRVDSASKYRIGIRASRCEDSVNAITFLSGWPHFGSTPELVCVAVHVKRVPSHMVHSSCSTVTPNDFQATLPCLDCEISGKAKFIVNQLLLFVFLFAHSLEKSIRGEGSTSRAA